MVIAQFLFALIVKYECMVEQGKAGREIARNQLFLESGKGPAISSNTATYNTWLLPDLLFRFKYSEAEEC